MVHYVYFSAATAYKSRNYCIDSSQILLDDKDQQIHMCTGAKFAVSDYLVDHACGMRYVVERTLLNSEFYI